jgi:hypothetical protein
MDCEQKDSGWSEDRFDIGRGIAGRLDGKELVKVLPALSFGLGSFHSKK